MGGSDQFSPSRVCSWTTSLKIFINDLPDKVKNPCKLFADDCKLLGKIEKDGDLQGIQEDINSLQSWSKTCQMSFNYEKCKVMHFGRNNAEHEYIME